MIQLSRAATKALQLHVMGLATPFTKTATKATLLHTIERMQLLQLDTISVVNRSHYLVLYARVGEYPLAWLDQLLAAGRCYEVWAHEACIASNNLLWLLRSHARNRSHWSQKQLQRIVQTDQAAMNLLLKHVRETGPVKSSDFETPPRPSGQGAGWWNWKPHKRYLEAWFAAGELMVARRDGFARVYDLAERVKPELVNKKAMALAKAHYSDEQVAQQMQATAVKALGITPARWINDFFRTTPYIRDAQLRPLLQTEQLIQVQVQDSPVPWYVHSDHKSWLKKAANETLAAPQHCALLSPFDPLVWHRQRAAEMFGFEYRIECYTPEPKRRYGYFTLPILYRDDLVGRVDCKAHRAQGVFEIKTLHFEPLVAVTDSLIAQLSSTINRFAHWHDCQSIVVTQVSRAGVIKRLKAALK